MAMNDVELGPRSDCARHRASRGPIQNPPTPKRIVANVVAFRVSNQASSQAGPQTVSQSPLGSALLHRRLWYWRSVGLCVSGSLPSESVLKSNAMSIGMRFTRPRPRLPHTHQRSGILARVVAAQYDRNVDRIKCCVRCHAQAVCPRFGGDDSGAERDGRSTISPVTE
jgi:hypothetical protein